MEYWSDLYKELATLIKAERPKILWIDLWNEQVNYLTEELPFPAPAVFLAFNALDCEDKGNAAQECNTQIDIYLYFETFSDTYQGSYNQAGAMDFLKELTELHKILHATDGTNYSGMRRTSMHREDNGGAGNLYRLTFECIVDDTSAGKKFDEKTEPNQEFQLTKQDINRLSNDDTPLFAVET